MSYWNINDRRAATGGAGSIEALLQTILGGKGGGGGNQLLNTILAPLLKIQERGFGDQSRALTDTFRAAGALRGGSYGIAVPRLLGDQALARSALIGSTTSQMLGPLLQALISSQKLGAGVGGAASSGWENIPPSLGLQTPMSSDQMSGPNYGYERGQVTPPGSGSGAWLGGQEVKPTAGGASTGGGGGDQLSQILALIDKALSSTPPLTPSYNPTYDSTTGLNSDQRVISDQPAAGGSSYYDPYAESYGSAPTGYYGEY